MDSWVLRALFLATVTTLLISSKRCAMTSSSTTFSTMSTTTSSTMSSKTLWKIYSTKSSKISTRFTMTSLTISSTVSSTISSSRFPMSSSSKFSISSSSRLPMTSATLRKTAHPVTSSTTTSTTKSSLLSSTLALTSSPATPSTTPTMSPRTAILLARPRPRIAVSLSKLDATTWRATASSIFRRAAAIQVYRMFLYDDGDAGDGDRLQQLADEVLSVLLANPVAPLLQWTASSTGGAVPRQASAFSARHHKDRLGQNFFIIATYSERALELLLQANVWFPESHYLVFLDTGLLPVALRCAPSVSWNVSEAVWDAHAVVAVVVLAACPWSASVLSPFHVGQSRHRAFPADDHRGLALALQGLFLNLHGAELPVSIYPSDPTLVRKNDSGRPSSPTASQFEGVDGWVMRAAAKQFNFSAKIIYPEDREAHGFVEKGKGSGTLGLVMTSRAWISFNSRFVKDYDTREIRFSYPYVFDELCAMVPRSDRVPNYIMLFRCLSVEVWIVLLVTYLSTAFTTYYMDGVLAPHRAFPRPRPSAVAFTVYSVLLAGSTGPPHDRARETSTLLLLALGLIFNVVFMGAFQGLLFKSLTSPQYYPDINTLAELAESGMLVTTRSRALQDTFNFSSAEMVKIQSNFRVVSKNWTMTDGRPYSILIRRNGAYLRAENKPRHLVDECPRKYMLSYILHWNFPFLDELNIFLMRCMDAGLMESWLRRTYLAVPHPRSGEDQVISFEEVQAAFFVLAVGVLAGSCALVAELLHHRVATRS